MSDEEFAWAAHIKEARAKTGHKRRGPRDKTESDRRAEFPATVWCEKCPDPFKNADVESAHVLALWVARDSDPDHVLGKPCALDYAVTWIEQGFIGDPETLVDAVYAAML